MSIPGSASPLFFTAAADAAAAGPIKSVRFNSADSAYLNRTPSSAGSNTTWTLSTWVKKTGNDNHIFGAGAGNTPGRFGFGFNGSNEIFAFVIASGSTVFSITTDAVFRDPAAWYHIVLIADTGNSTQADRFKIYVNGVLQSVSGTLMPSSQNTFVNTTAAHTFGRRSYTASDYFNGYLASTILVDGTAKEATDFGAFDDNGVWQAAAYSGSFGTNGFHLFDFANESGIGDDSSGNDNDFSVNNLTPITTLNTTGVTTTVPEDLTGDWLGILNVTPTDTNGPVAVFPDGSGVSNTRGTFFWSGLTSGDTITWYGTSSGQNRQVTGDVDESTVDVPGGTLGSFTLTVNAASGSAKIDFNGSANCYGITPGVTTSLPFDVLFDVPTNGDSSDDTGAGGEVSGNYATWNPLSGFGTLSNGNLDNTGSATTWRTRPGTIGMSSGKWYFEWTHNGGSAHLLGIGTSDYPQTNYVGSDSQSWGYYSSNGQKYHNSSSSSYGDSWTTGDVIGVAFDADNGNLYFYKNGIAQNSGTAAYTGLTSGPYFPVISLNGTANTGSVNFGQRAWAYSAPSNYKALCTTNLPTPTIADGSDYFDAKLYTGNGSTQTISGLGFSPDLVWIKNRAQADNHKLLDTVRGATEELESNTTDAEVTNTDGLTAFNSDGFDLGADVEYNTNTESYVAWTWDAGSSTVSNTDGSITSSVRANQTAGFSIVTWTGNGTDGATVGHGLNAAPELLLQKRRDASENWLVYHSATGNAAYLKLNDTDAAFTGSGVWDTTDPTSSVFTISDSTWHNANSGTFVSYCFAPVANFSSFGSYVGNGSNDGVFVHTGFSVRWLLTKASSHGSDWQLWDSARQSYNVNANTLTPNSNSVETGSAGYAVDLLSNGFKFRLYGSSSNQSGYTYIWAAFASNPFQANGGLAR